MLRIEFRPNGRRITPVIWSISNSQLQSTAEVAEVEYMWRDVWRVCVTGEEVEWIAFAAPRLRSLVRRHAGIVYVGDDALFIAANFSAIVGTSSRLFT